MVSASPEAPSAIPAEWSAEATAGATERKRPTEPGVRPITIGRQFPSVPEQALTHTLGRHAANLGDRARTYKSKIRVRFRENRTLSRHAESDPIRMSHAVW